MIISYQGVESFKIQFGDTIVAYNPVSKDSKFKPTKFGADIVLISANHEDLAGADQASRGDREAFLISSPGEYEVGGVFVRGFLTHTQYGVRNGELKNNTVYMMNLEGMNLCFLGAIRSSDDLQADAIEALDDIDVLFVPIGGDGVLAPDEAYKLAVKLQAKIIIPMHYGENISTTALKQFLKEGGEEKVSPIDKFTLKKKDLEGKESEVVVLSASTS